MISSRGIQRLLLVTLCTTLWGCANTPLQTASALLSKFANHSSPAVQGSESCQNAIIAPLDAAAPTLDPRHIDLFVWNIEKGLNPESFTDLERLAGNKNLVLIQEARLEQQPFDALELAKFWSFAPGYKTTSASTGVMTMSDIAPATHCYLSDREPWLRSPKAISITRFGLASTDVTLVVVNVHAVNFTWGVADFSRQVSKIEAALAMHKGPVIVAGDFNTWRKRRLDVLQDVAERLELEELAFDVDQRVTPFGSIVDRIFVRGLDTSNASTTAVTSSDHNPMSVTLSMQ